MMIPIFQAGEAVSAGKLNLLGAAVRGGGVECVGSMETPQHLDEAERAEQDFAVEWTTDSDGEWGWCWHQGRVLVGEGEYPVGDNEWTLIGGADFVGVVKLKVLLDDEGGFVSASVSGEEGGGAESGGAESGGDSREYELATITEKKCIWVHAGGPVYVLKKDAAGLKAGKGIRITPPGETVGDGDDGGGEVADAWVVEALIEDAKEPSTADHSLIYEEAVGGSSASGGGNSGSESSGNQGNQGNQGGDDDGSKEKPYKLKLLCSSDGSVDIKDEKGRLSLSAQKVEPGDGLMWKQEEDQETGDMKDTSILQIKIDSTGVSSGEDGQRDPEAWKRLDLSVSKDGLSGAVRFTVDSTKVSLGGAKVGLKMGTDEALRLEVEGSVGVEYNFRAPLRQNGEYVVLDVNKEYQNLADGTKIKLDVVGTKLDLVVDTSNTVTPGGGGCGGGGQYFTVDSDWTVLGCDTEHAVRLKLTADSRLYIQLGHYLVTSQKFEPVN